MTLSTIISISGTERKHTRGKTSFNCKSHFMLRICKEMAHDWISWNVKMATTQTKSNHIQFVMGSVGCHFNVAC